ncbi:5-demethoxyubiquinol-8 5-hydroxylase UbiM [uncultured Piscinibacter sp.]|uniref:5-demethoxyubiquinol-8 5-hydroxylase UbiM n=1 Tax=uncultured Piscinibacter sp. TaxID=1131835 RepID=UPI00261F2991|nr:5-demethoxyubiquinol-8 5-hydroxylase UbiM [uncultured Piscinibacter sp.]
MPSSRTPHDTDVLIIGAGPSGLALARALADAQIRSIVLDGQSAETLAEPAPDGRDIALTHRAQAIMRRLDLWERLPAAEVAPLREAVVYNGRDPQALHFDAQGSGEDELGHLVANHLVRRASWEAVLGREAIGLRPATRVIGLRIDAEGAIVSCRSEDGAEVELRAPLAVAADSRFSEARRCAGIGAQMRDFGRSVIVCRMTHSAPNRAVAQECFHTGHTLAVLPMNGGESSIVVTVSTDRAGAMQRWSDEQFAGWVQQQLGGRLGTMALKGVRHLYPLVAVYADRFVAPRFALIGDAAVGMHPVTAHGYNFGLYGVDVLSDLLASARRNGRDLGSPEVLRPYETRHRRETWPIYHGTNALVGLFTDDGEPARLLRQAVIRVAERLPPLKAVITDRLTRSGPTRWPPLSRPPLPPMLASLWKP